MDLFFNKVINEIFDYLKPQNVINICLDDVINNWNEYENINFSIINNTLNNKILPEHVKLYNNISNFDVDKLSKNDIIIFENCNECEVFFEYLKQSLNVLSKKNMPLFILNNFVVDFKDLISEDLFCCYEQIFNNYFEEFISILGEVDIDIRVSFNLSEKLCLIYPTNEKNKLFYENLMFHDDLLFFCINNHLNNQILINKLENKVSSLIDRNTILTKTKDELHDEKTLLNQEILDLKDINSDLIERNTILTRTKKVLFDLNKN